MKLWSFVKIPWTKTTQKITGYQKKLTVYKSFEELDQLTTQKTLDLLKCSQFESTHAVDDGTHPYSQQSMTSGNINFFPSQPNLPQVGVLFQLHEKCSKREGG